MDDRDYLELARSFRDHFKALGLHDIADFRNYIENEDGERMLPDGRTLMKQMLEAFDRYLAMNASETVEEALTTIRKSIDGEEGPETALVHLEDERMATLERRGSAVPIATLGKLLEVRSELGRLREFLLSDPDDPQPGWGPR